MIVVMPPLPDESLAAATMRTLRLGTDRPAGHGKTDQGRSPLLVSVDTEHRSHLRVTMYCSVLDGQPSGEKA
jgi:hypothetical protein